MYLDISAWRQSLAFFDKIFWFIALLFSALFLLQALISLFAGGDTYDASGDADDVIDGDDGIDYCFFHPLRVDGHCHTQQRRR
jgi:hypothetical protein